MPYFYDVFTKKFKYRRPRKFDINSLSYKQRKFIEAYFVKKMSATDSVIEAGYTKNRHSASAYSYRLLKSPKIKAYVLKCKLQGIDDVDFRGNMQISKTIDDKINEVVASENNTMKFIKDAFHEKLEQLEEIIKANLPGKNPTVDEKKDCNFTAAISAISEYNKMQGYHAPTKSVHVSLNKDPEVQKMLEISRKMQLELEEKDKDGDRY